MGRGDEEDLMPLGKAIEARRFRLLPTSPKGEAALDAAWTRTARQMEDFVAELITAKATAALERERDHLRRCIERSDDRCAVIRENGGNADHLAAEADIRRAFQQDLDHVEALLAERENRNN